MTNEEAIQALERILTVCLSMRSDAEGKALQDEARAALEVLRDAEKKTAVSFVKWTAVYASQMGNGWVVMKGTEPTLFSSEKLFEEFKKNANI